MSDKLSYALLGYNKNIEWHGSSECVAKIVGVHRWEVVESRYVGGSEKYFKVCGYSHVNAFVHACVRGYSHAGHRWTSARRWL